MKAMKAKAGTPKNRTTQPTGDFTPYANERDVLTLGNLAIENRLDRLSLHGDVELTFDQAGLALARRLQAVVDAAVRTLEAQRDLPETVQRVPAQTVKNPFA